MRFEALQLYRCPDTGGTLVLGSDAVIENGQVLKGSLSCGACSYPVVDGLPNFAPHVSGTAAFARGYYAGIAHSYDENVHVTFDLYGENETDIRERMIDLLHLKPGSKVIEVSAGTGRDSEIIARRIGPDGQLSLVDISPDMLMQAKERLKQSPAPVDIAVGDACFLPFADNCCDALYCFAGVGHFPDQRRALKEMARVVRPGGRVVFCEKNVPPWLQRTLYGKILINNNPMFAEPVPLDLIPVEARELGIRWINGNVHYVVDYTVGEGEPIGCFDVELPGARGGTFNTRYFGKLEGVSPQAKHLYQQAAAAKGVSLHAWLDAVVRQAAERDLDGQS